eukprot:scaffold120564_cov57-Phaeocystis_antarctica.AAC.1
MTASPLGSVGPAAAPSGARIAGSSGALALLERSELVRARLGSVRWFVCWRMRRVLVQRSTPEPVGQPGFRSSVAACGLVAMPWCGYARPSTMKLLRRGCQHTGQTQ